MSRPTLFLLHALGMSGREWAGVVAALGDGFDCVALDLPGFGARAADPRTGIEEMVDWLADEVRARAPAAWMVVGHSMGGKLATLLALRAMAGEQGLSGLAGVVLAAASPLVPEPMDEARREGMIGWAADGAIGEADAKTFVEANLAAPLPADLMATAVADVRASGRHAWLAWLERGSREDWSSTATPLSVPAMILAGSDDGDLGEAAQRRFNAALYRDARIEAVDGAAHLLPLERPRAVAALIAAHWRHVADRALPPRFARVLASDRVSARTRAVMLGRIAVPQERCLSDGQRETLAAITARVLPGCGGDLVARMEAELEGEGDGWRFADLPPDVEAWARSLDALDGFAALDAAGQDERLTAVHAGEVAGGGLTGTQLRRWFEDVRAAAVRAWLSQPAALARIGWDGFAQGGDGVRKQGYARTAAGDLEPWQPRAGAA